MKTMKKEPNWLLDQDSLVMGVFGGLSFSPNSRKLMIALVAGGGFEPPTFGL